MTVPPKLKLMEVHQVAYGGAHHYDAQGLNGGEKSILHGGVDELGGAFRPQTNTAPKEDVGQNKV